MTRTTVALLLISLLSGCDVFGTKGRLHRISRNHDPAAMQLEPAFNEYVRRAFLPSGIELGVVDFQDGSQAKYWFQSHHQVSDRGGAWFEFADGQRIFVTHLFCCEVQLARDQPENAGVLRSTLVEWNDKVRRAGY